MYVSEYAIRSPWGRGDGIKVQILKKKRRRKRKKTTELEKDFSKTPQKTVKIFVIGNPEGFPCPRQVS